MDGVILEIFSVFRGRNLSTATLFGGLFLSEPNLYKSGEKCVHSGLFRILRFDEKKIIIVIYSDIT